MIKHPQNKAERRRIDKKKKHEHEEPKELSVEEFEEAVQALREQGIKLKPADAS